MAQSVADKLDEAAKLIERGWVQCEDALDANGEYVSPTDPSAVCWCAWGAIDAVTPNRFAREDVRAAFRKVTGGGVSTWNDFEGRTQAQVIGAFKRAAELARGEQA